MPKLERRTHPGSAACTTATLCLGAEELGLFDLLDLSASGALVRGRCPVRPGHEVKVRLHFFPLEVVVDGVVVREQVEGRAAFALQFAEMAPEMRACLRNLLHAQRPPRPRRGEREPLLMTS